MKLKRNFEKSDLINLICMIMLTVLFVWIGIKYAKPFNEIKGEDMVSTAQNLKELILSYGNTSLLIVITLHVFQTVISVIPAAVVQIAGGILYGIPLAMITGIIGVAIGTAVSFYLARLLGRNFITLFVSEKQLSRIEGLLSRNTSTLVLLFLYVIPFPKDFIAYFIGLTNMKASKLFIISAIGRLPGMFVASYLGFNLIDRNYALLIIVTALSGILLLLSYIFKDKILAYLSKRKT